MSEENEARALMYLNDAVTDKMTMEGAFNAKIFPPAVFHAQQTAEKAAKACLALKGIYIKDHRYTTEFKREIIAFSGDLNEKYLAIFKDLIRLESFNTEPRYSVTHRDIFYTLFTEKTVQEFCDQAARMLELCFRFIELKTGIDALPRERGELLSYILKHYHAYIRKKEL